MPLAETIEDLADTCAVEQEVGLADEKTSFGILVEVHEEVSKPEVCDFIFRASERNYFDALVLLCLLVIENAIIGIILPNPKSIMHFILADGKKFKQCLFFYIGIAVLHEDVR